MNVFHTEAKSIKSLYFKKIGQSWEFMGIVSKKVIVSQRKKTDEDYSGQIAISPKLNFDKSL